MKTTTALLSSPFTFSQSSLQDYVDCPRRFQLRYIEQLQWPAVESAPVLENEQRQIEGQDFHRLVQQFFIGLPAEKITPPASTENLRRWWDNFRMHPPQVADHYLYTELTLSAPIEGHLLIAKYDLVAVDPGKSAVIYDWKTYRHRPSNSWLANRMQTKVYPSLLFRSGKHLNKDQPFPLGKTEMIYWFADFPGEQAIFSFDESKDKSTWNELKQLVKEIAAKQSFPMTENEKLCGYCVFRSYCDRGKKAGEGEVLETGPAIDNFNFEQIQEIEF